MEWKKGWLWIGAALALAYLGKLADGLWTANNDEAIGWTCSAIAISMAVVVVASLLSGRDPARLPRAMVFLVWGVVVIVVVIGALVQGLPSLQRPAYMGEPRGAAPLVVALLEVFGFSLIQLGCLLLPRACAPAEPPRTAPPSPG